MQLSGRKNTTALGEKKLNYITTIIQSRVCEKQSLHLFGSLSKFNFVLNPNENCISYSTSNNVIMIFKKAFYNCCTICTCNVMKDHVIDYLLAHTTGKVRPDFYCF